MELFLFTLPQLGGRIRPGSRDPTALAPRGVPGPPLTRTGSLKACLALSCFLIFKGSECPRKSDLVPFLPVQSPDPNSLTQFIIPDMCRCRPGCARGGSIAPPLFLGYRRRATLAAVRSCRSSRAPDGCPPRDAEGRAGETRQRQAPLDLALPNLPAGFPAVRPPAEAGSCLLQAGPSLPCQRGFALPSLQTGISVPAAVEPILPVPLLRWRCGCFIKTPTYLPSAFTSPSPIPPLPRLQKRFSLFFLIIF